MVFYCFVRAHPMGAGMHFVLMKMFVSRARKRTNYLKHNKLLLFVK